MNRYNTKSKDKQGKSEIEYFPRGKDDFSFNNAKADPSHSASFLSKKRNKSEMQHKASKSKDLDQLQIEKATEGERSRVMTPHFKVGDLVLLTISEIRKDYMIANYTRNKKAMIHSSYCGIDDEDFSFAKYFKVGQFVNGAVVSPGNDLKLPSGHTNKKLLVSIDPKIVNTGMKGEKIVVGMDLYGQLCIDNKGRYYPEFRFEQRSQEDEEEEEGNDEPEAEPEDDDDDDVDMDGKGRKKRRSTKPIKYIMADNETEEDRAIFHDKTINSYYYFKVIKSHFNIKKQQREITLSLNQLKYKFTIKSLDFSMLRPGFFFKVNITRELTNGIEVAFGGNIGSIFIDHIKSSTKTKNIFARIIHLSTTKQITGLSTLSHIKHLQCDSIEAKEGLVGGAYQAIISKEVYGKSYKINLLNEDKEVIAAAFLHNNNMIPKDNDGEYKEKEIIEKVIVKEYNFFDNSPICTMKTENEFVNWNTMAIGTMVNSCTIDRINNSEIIVKMNDFIEGRIPLEHLTDHPLNKIPKKFKKGMKIKTRVFACDPKTKKLLLTMKETLLDPEITLHGNVRELTEGEDVYVVYVGKGLFEHSGNVIGKLMRFNTMKESDFKLGKLYKYKVYKVNHHSHKVYFTNDKEIWLPGIGDYDTFIKRNHILSNITTLLNTFEANDDLFNEGTVHKFTTVPIATLIKALLKRKVDPKLIEEDKEALTNQYLFAKYQSESKGNYYIFIPKGLLIDFFTEQLFSKLQNEDSEVEVLVLYHNKETKTLFGTMKQSLIKHREAILHIDPSIEKIKEQLWENDKVYYGYVNKTTPKGVMVQFYGRKKILMRPQATNSAYVQGQTVICRYMNKKFYFDVNAYHMYSNEDFVNESNEYFDLYKAFLKQMKSEDSSSKAIMLDIEGTVTSINDYGAVISLAKSLPKSTYSGLINKEHMLSSSSLTEGTKGKFNVIDVDYLNGIIHLKQLDKAMQSLPKEKLEINEVYDIAIDLINTHYIVGNCKGNKVFIRSALYDFSVLNAQGEFNSLKIGANVETMVTSYDKQLNAYIAAIPLAIITRLKGKGKRKQSENIGEVITGKINSIKGNFIYVVISKTSIGKIHLSNFNGNIDHIKSLLAMQVQQQQKSSKSSSERKLSVESNTSVTIPQELIIKAKIVSVEDEKKNMKVYGLSSLLTDDDDEDNEEEAIENVSKTSLSNTLDLSGNKPNQGVISSIKNFSKYPITISINNQSKTKPVINANKIQIPFNDIPLNKISLDNDATIGGIRFKVGQSLPFYSSINNLHSLHPITSSLPSSASSPIEIGKVYPMRVLKAINGRGLILDLNHKDSEAFADICEITDSLSSNPLDYYQKGHIVKGRVLSKDEKSNRFSISLRSSIVNDSDYSIIKDGSTIQFKQRFPSSVDLRNQVMKFGSNTVIDMNTLAIGYITSSSEKGTFIKLASNVIVRVSMRELTDEKTATKPYLLFKENTLAICRIVSVYKKDPSNVKYNASMRESIVKYSLSLHMKDLALNNFYYCVVMNANDKGYDLNIAGSTFTGLMKMKNYAAAKASAVTLKPGEVIVVQLVKYDKNSHPPKLRFSNKEISEGKGFDVTMVINALGKEEIEKCEENAEVYRNVIAINEAKEKERNIEEIIDMTKGENDIDYEELIKDNSGRKDSDAKANLAHSDDEEDNDDEDGIDEDLLLEEDKDIITKKEEKFALLSGVNAKMDIDNEEDEDDKDVEMKDAEDAEAEEEDKAKPKKSASQREKSHLSQELKIRQKENAQTEEINMEHFEKLILNDPNNSLNWLQYATYILDTLNLNSARKVFERAIKSIDITQSKEKLNIWVAYLNLESLYGTSEAFKFLTDRALEVNDKKSIYLHLISIYKQTNKYHLANEMFRLVTKECFNDFEVWRRYVEFLFDAIGKDAEDIQTPKEGLNKAMQVLPKKRHLEILLCYGQLLYAHNSFEEARNTFEAILKNLPKRKDIWFVYADKELKYSKNVGKVRQVYDKMLMVEFKKNALKGVLAKYLKFEQENGSEKEFVVAQERAQRIISQRMDVDDDDDEKDKDKDKEEGNEQEDNE